jgi:polar amino acid transport system substrate-binding protein
LQLLRFIQPTCLLPVPIFLKANMSTLSTRHFLTTSSRLGLGLALGLMLGACGKTEAPVAASVTAAAESRVYVVGTDAAYAPFESQNASGEIVGFDIDVVKAVAAKAGIQVRFVNTPWEGIFNALNQGDRDLLVSAVTITTERRESMDFSAPYFDARQLIALRGATEVSKFTDLKTLKVGVQNGTTGDEAISKLQGKTSTNIKRFESTPLALKELEAGGVDAVVADNGVVVHYVNNNAGAKFRTVADNSFAAEQYGIAVKKGNTELLAKLDQGLAGIKADGSYAKIYTSYFGAETIAPATVAPVAAASAAASAAK